MDKDEVIVELYKCLLQASGCVKSLDALRADLHLDQALPGLPRVRKGIEACLKKHNALYHDLEMVVYRKGE